MSWISTGKQLITVPVVLVIAHCLFYYTFQASGVRIKFHSTWGKSVFSLSTEPTIHQFPLDSCCESIHIFHACHGKFSLFDTHHRASGQAIKGKYLQNLWDHVYYVNINTGLSTLVHGVYSITQDHLFWMMLPGWASTFKRNAYFTFSKIEKCDPYFLSHSKGSHN